MKVLMFGWEFPPHISGGLGTACAGLTRALERENVDVIFSIPKLHGGEQSDRTTFINASSIPIRQKKPIRSSGSETAAGKDHPLKTIMERRTSRGHTLLEVPSTLSAYTPPSEELSGGLKNWNYSFDVTSEQTVPPSSGASGSRPRAGKLAGYTKKPYAFSGLYGRDLLEEVRRYAQVGAEITRRNSFDVIHTHDWMTFPAGMEARKVSGKPLIVHLHSTEIDRSGKHVNPQVFAIEKQGMLQADKVVAVSQWTKNIAVNHYNIDEKKIEVVHNGVTLKESAITSSFRPPLGSPVVTFLGRITHQKGPMYFAEAARKVHKQFPEVHFVVAGSGDQLPMMIQRIAQVHLSGHFHFTGFLTGEDIDRIWAMSNVYVMPSVSEPFGIAPLEAIQAGVPVIISKQAGVSEVMPHAMKVDFWDSEALAEAICNVLRFKSLVNTLKKNSAEEVKTITWEKAAKKLINLYYELSDKDAQTKRPGLLFPGSPAPPLAHAALF